ncbi:N-acetyl-D-glucosamine kinase [Vanessa cardui]|uniref:N-acetyl-D-glucosamine kinase n=1 Tax=Vanessa cardui TaxID=171605 RepID=UPI001F13249F|nr:N-acetyl-D-glucosamine kinase [Vanessa cardui]
MDKMYFGGVEGGATHSNLVICNEFGKVVGKAQGPGTNHWVLGIDECAKRIIDMLHAAKEDAGIPLDQPIDSLGLTLSGCEQESSNADLAVCVREKDAACAGAIYVASDTAGSLFTGAPNGGMVLIAGTGSNGLLRTPDGQQYGCGGWGYLLGDEGGAYWIAHRAVKAIFDDEDGLLSSPHPTERVWEVISEHFKAETRADLLPYAYKHFDKSHFAGLTAKLSSLAAAGDALSRHVLALAGAALAGHAAALAERAPPASSLRVVCVGSVWNSWDALRPGFLKQLAARRVKIELELVRLKVSSAMGAAWLAAKHVNYRLPRDDSAFCEVFYTYRPDVNGKVNGTHNGKLDNGLEGCGCNDWSYWS